MQKRIGLLLTSAALMLCACSSSSNDDAGTGMDALPTDLGPGGGPTDTGGAPADTGPGGGGKDAQPSGADTGPGMSIVGLSDQFTGSALDPSWMMLHGDAAMISVHDHALWIQPTRPILWYNAQEGLQLFKMVTGNFKATAAVHARKASNPSVPPDQGPHLGGVMARDPQAPPENYVFIVVGHDQTKVAVETKTTQNSNSTYPAVTWPNGDAELRVCRVADQFMMYRRNIGDTTWQSAVTFSRPDLPNTLAVGPNTYAFILPNGGTPDLIVSFDRFLFGDVAGMADCTTD